VFEMKIGLPIKGSLALVYAGSLTVAGLLAVVSLVGLLNRSAVYPTEELLSAFVPNDVTSLLVGVPVLMGCMGLARRGNLVGLLGWVGALFFVPYNDIAYVMALPLNWVFVVHLVLAVLSLYTLVGLIAGIDGKALQGRLSSAVPERLGGGVLAGLGLLFFLRVIAVFAAAITGGASIPATELAVNTSDFLITPAWIIGGILLWQRRSLGYVAGLGLLLQGSMLFIALIVVLLLRPMLTGAPLAAVDVLVVLVMGLVCFVPFGLFVRGAASA
jgi:hypothetical protein